MHFPTWLSNNVQQHKTYESPHTTHNTFFYNANFQANPMILRPASYKYMRKYENSTMRGPLRLQKYDKSILQQAENNVKVERKMTQRCQNHMKLRENTKNLCMTRNHALEMHSPMLVEQESTKPSNFLSRTYDLKACEPQIYKRKHEKSIIRGPFRLQKYNKSIMRTRRKQCKRQKKNGATLPESHEITRKHGKSMPDTKPRTGNAQSNAC